MLDLAYEEEINTPESNASKDAAYNTEYVLGNYQ
jgi:hypothetical protein